MGNDEPERGRRRGGFLAQRQLITGLVVGFCVGALGLASTSCDPESCDQIRDSYQQAVDSEPGLVSLDEDGPPHVAMALQLDLVNELTGDLVDREIGEAMSLRGAMDVEGQSVDYRVVPSNVDLQFEASGACDGCLRVFGDIGGEVEVDIPVVGIQSTPLSGSMDWTVPLDVARDGEDVAVFFDSEEAVRMGGLELEANLNRLPGDWSRPITDALVAELSERVVGEVEPFRLAGYEMPNLGVDDLEIAPALFVLDEASNSMVLGLTSNLGVSASSRDDAEFVEALSLADGQNAGLGVHPRVVVEAVRLGFREGDIPRRYTIAGNADREGPAFAVVDDLGVGPHETRTDNLGLGLNFRVFNFRSRMACFSMRGETKGRMGIDAGRLDLEIEDVEFTGPAGVADAANWGAAEFVEHSQRLISRSLDDGVVSMPETDMDLQFEALDTAAGMMVVRGTGS